ncbi:Zinc finger, C3HC4 type (RING finger) protein [Ceratobasidium sp. AG-Ba]|nr:Zinc finger, C3HC4 type (RING finger) protein [Ceratobasidium sp. AG-Ba]
MPSTPSFPSLTLWTLDGPPDDSSDGEAPPPVPPRPSARDRAKAVASFHSGRQSESEVDSDDDEFFDTPMADINDRPEQETPATSIYESLSSDDPSRAKNVERILNSERHTATFPGTSQYARGGSSACGLASMNAIRLAFELCSKIDDKEALISALISEEYVKNAMEITSFWSDQMHLEVEAIMDLPMFARSLKLKDEQYKKVHWRVFSDTAIALQSHDEAPGPRGVMLTRPPEMIALMYIPLPLSTTDRAPKVKSIYIVFDSHPRPSHPDGTALQIFPSTATDDVADYLADLLQFDEAIMNDPALEWHAQLLGQVSCHFFAPAVDLPQNEYAMNMTFLTLKQLATENKDKLAASEKENRQLRSRVFDLEQEVAWLGNTDRRKQEEIRQLKSQADNKSHRGSAKDSSWTWDAPVKRNSKGKGRETQSGWTDPKLNTPQKTTGRFYNNDNWPKPQPATSSGRSVSSRARTLPSSTSGPGPSGSRSGRVDQEDADLQRSLEVALALQQQFDDESIAFSRDQTLAQAYERPKFDCNICMDSFTDEAIALVEGCDHSCCRECMRSHVQSKIDERRYPITCPFCVVGTDEKSQARANIGVISPMLVENIGVTPEQYVIYVELQLAEHSIMIDCRKYVYTPRTNSESN